MKYINLDKSISGSKNIASGPTICKNTYKSQGQNILPSKKNGFEFYKGVIKKKNNSTLF